MSLTSKSSLSVSPATARSVIGGFSLAYGAAAIVAPLRTARLFGVRTTDPQTVALAQRFVGVRNATMGAAMMQADGAVAQRAATTLGLAVGASDVLAVLVAARHRALAPRAVVVALATLVGLAGLGAAALKD